MSPAAGNHGWSTPATLRDRLRRRWDRGDFLSAVATPSPEAVFPLRVPLRGPTPREFANDFSSVRDWIAAWQKQDAAPLEWRQANHRLFGQNAIPAAAVFERTEEVVRLLGARKEWERFQGLVETARNRMPSLLPWLARRPLRALELGDDWDRLLGVVEWSRKNPRPHIYVRQMNVPGVHTKFVESYRKVLAEWLDLTLPPEAIDASARGASGFNRRYGFLDKPERIRTRFLDSAKAPLSDRLGLDIALDAAAFARLDPGVRRVFITENEINFLAFPEASDSLIVFGSGYGWSTLAEAAWLHRCRVLYWGDIDTHGFAILDQLRAHLPHAESFLMDRATLEAFRDLWVKEPQPVRRELPRLNAQEQALYNELRDNRLAPNVRLEQERIAYSWLNEKLQSTMSKNPARAPG